MACATSALDLPLHANLGVMAQRHRRLLRQAHQPAPQTWRVPIRRGTPSCNRALHRRDQRRSQTLRLDGTRKPHPRCCQTRERKVRVDPLARRLGYMPLASLVSWAGTTMVASRALLEAPNPASRTIRSLRPTRKLPARAAMIECAQCQIWEYPLPRPTIGKLRKPR